MSVEAGAPTVAEVIDAKISLVGFGSNADIALRAIEANKFQPRVAVAKWRIAMPRADADRWLRAPPLGGWAALFCTVGAIGVPTLVRLAVNGVVTGCEFTPYLPFVFICAMLLRWWFAGAVAMGAIAMLAGVFEGPPLHALALPCFLPSAAMFGAASAGMIAVALLVRRAIRALQMRGADGASGGIVFSLDRGEVWASWYGRADPVRLGNEVRVAEMMHDFLKQEELAKRLARRTK